MKEMQFLKKNVNVKLYFFSIDDQVTKTESLIYIYIYVYCYFFNAFSRQKHNEVVFFPT